MEINKAALAKGDRNEFLKLARSIRPSTTLNKAEHPLAAQFFGDNSTEVRHLDTRQLIESLAGQPYNEKLKWIEAVAAAGYAGIALDRPSKMADVTRIGGGAGWTAPKPAVASAKALEAALRKNRAAKGITATTIDADTAVLTALLAEIVKALIGCDPDTLDSGTVKTRFTAALKKAGPVVAAQVKAITDELAEATMKNAFTSSGGKWIQEGSRLSLSI